MQVGISGVRYTILNDQVKIVSDKGKSITVPFSKVYYQYENIISIDVHPAQFRRLDEMFGNAADVCLTYSSKDLA